MANEVRNASGKFAPKSDAPRKVRSVNLTDAAWDWLARTARSVDLTRNDYLEALARGSLPFMEMESTASPEPSMEMDCQCLFDAADLLNRLKAKQKKSKATLGDVEAILQMLRG